MRAAATTPSPGDASLLDTFRGAVADDLRTFAALHGRELDQPAIADLKRLDFPANLGLRLTSELAAQGAAAMRAALAALPADAGPDVLDELAVDYVDIYLTHALRAAPTESVWLDRENLERQEPMFAVRDYYRRHGLRVIDWAKRPDDHLVTQLEFLAHLFREGHDDALAEAAGFLDEHLRRWLGQFAKRVAQRCQTPFYAALAMLTMVYIEELRDILAALLDKPRPSREELETLRDDSVPAELPLPVSGAATGPGW